MDQIVRSRGGRATDVHGQQSFAFELGRALDRVEPGLSIAETLAFEGVEPRALLAALQERVCPGALARWTGRGWALDWPEAPGLPPLWRRPGIPAEPGESPRFPTDEQAAACLRLLDAVALGLGLGRGHVLPLYENPARRAVELEAFCDLPSLSREAVIARVAQFLDLGVPLAAALGIRHESGDLWSGYWPEQRWSKLLLSPRGEGLRPRLPEEFQPAADEGFWLLLVRPLADGVAVNLPAGLCLDALSRLLAALATAAENLSVRLVIEGEVSGTGLVGITVEPEGDTLRVTLPPLPAGERSGALLHGVIDCVSALGGTMGDACRQVTLRFRGAGFRPGMRNLLATVLRHPALIHLAHRGEVGPWSQARRPDEQPGDVSQALDSLLARPAEEVSLGAVAALLHGTSLTLDEGRFAIAARSFANQRGSTSFQALIAAAVALPPEAGQRAPLPASAHAQPAVLQADLDALLARLSRVGLHIDRSPLQRRLDRLCPLLARQEGSWGWAEVRRALTDRQLPGDWKAVSLELRLPGIGAPDAVAVAVPGGSGWQALPLAAVADVRLGRVTLPLAASADGPCAGLFPPGALDIALAGPRGTHAFRLHPGPGWESGHAEPAAPPDPMPGPSPDVAPGHPGLVLGL